MLKRFLCLSLIIGMLSLMTVKIEAWRGSAPPLTYLEVYAVGSEQYLRTTGNLWEYISRHQTITRGDHGGRWMVIVTKEIGYANPASSFAMMNGRRLRLIESEGFHVDPWDRIIDGWYCYWDASGHQGGRFEYRSTSINAPRNTMSDWINIR